MNVKPPTPAVRHPACRRWAHPKEDMKSAYCVWCDVSFDFGPDAERSRSVPK